MKKLITLAFCMVLSACAKDRSLEAVVTANNGTNGNNGTSSICTVQQQEGGALLSCSDGSYAFLSNGQTGQTGNSGSSCSVEETEYGALITCGDSLASIFNGLDGQDGEDGEDGQPGNSALVSVNLYSGDSCTLIAGTSSYVKKTGSNNFGLYSSSNCHSSSKTAEVSAGEAYSPASKVLAVWTSNGLRVYTFN
jgi:hypothetical protein